MRRNHRRSALTVVELLVVIAVIGILMALLLPAVQAARESGRNAQCKNNLKQIGLALQEHHDVNNRFPSAHRLDQNTVPGFNPRPPPPPDDDPSEFISWLARILPFIEEGPLHGQIDLEEGAWWHVGHRPEGFLNGEQIKLYLCPSDPNSRRKVMYEDMDIAFTDYLGVLGRNQFDGFSGILHVNGQVSNRQVTDGLSNTLIVGERPPPASLYWGWWFADAGVSPWFGSPGIVLGTDEREFPSPVGTADYYRKGPAQEHDEEHKWHFWSFHTAGANFVCADGSVHGINYNITPGLLGNLATKGKGEITPDDY